MITLIYSSYMRHKSIYRIGSAVASIVVALVLVYASKFGHSLSSDQAVWGQFGDYVGGLLNPLLSFGAFLAVLYSIRIQSDELEVQRDQSAQQNFESVFFNILNIFTSLSEKLTGQADFERLGKSGENKFSVIVKRIDGFDSVGLDSRSEIVNGFRADVEELFSSGALGYLEVFEQLVDCVDQYAKDKRFRKFCMPYSKLPESLGGGTHEHKLRERYSVLIRSVLSEDELKCLYALVHMQGAERKKLLRITCGYEYFKNLPKSYKQLLGMV